MLVTAPYRDPCDAFAAMTDSTPDLAARGAVGVVVLTWRGEQMSRAFLESLQG